ncbi:hypothetical protein HKD37_20G056439 [Glycine soja]
MVDHTTRKTTTDRLEDAIARLTNSQASLFDKYSDLFGNVNSILDHLRLRDANHNPTSSNTPFNHRSLVKLDISRGSSLCEGMGEGCCTQPYPCICKEAVSGFEPMTNKSPRHNFTAAPGLALQELQMIKAKKHSGYMNNMN